MLAESFVRLNQPAGKKYGGGHRVKQIVLKDNWDRMTQQYQSAYGQQYDYTTTEVLNGKTRNISSGVASYEPSIGGEENPFQEILQVANRLPLGPASYESIEMPILDAFYPAALVGYSKVTVRSIHHGKKDAGGRKSRSGIGRQVTEFYTAKDFPVRFNYTGIDPDSDKQKHAASLFKFFSKTSFDARAISQGFLVELNDMHGKMKSQSSYGEADTTTQLNHTRYYYRNTGQQGLNEKFDFVHNALGGEVKKGNMGIDIELMTDAREFSVGSTSQQVQAQVDWMIPAPFPVWLPFVWPVFGKSENYYRAVTTTKIVNYHSIVDSIVVIDKGSSATTKNQVFDAETGSVIVSSTNNEFDQPIYQTSYPAYWAYSGMGLAYKNIGVSFKGVNFLDGKPVSVIAPGDLKNYFESGDEIYVSGGQKPNPCEAIYLPDTKPTRLWVVDKKRNTSPLTDLSPDFIFVDKKGNPFTWDNVTIKVIRSGKRNLLGAQVASFASMVNPVTGTTVKKLSVSNSSQVLQASAIEYKEKWQTDRDIIKKYRTEKHSNLEGSNLVVNGDFSAGNTGFFSDYVVGSNTGTYQILTSVNGCKDKPMTGNMLVADGHTDADKAVWGQNITVEPGKDYMFTCWAQTVTSGTVARLIVKINGVVVSPTVVLFPTSCYWDHISFTWNAGAATTAVIKIIILKPQNRKTTLQSIILVSG